MTEAISSQMNQIHIESAPSPTIEIPRGEVYRYLGYRGMKPDEEMSGRIEPCISSIVGKSRLQAVWLTAPILAMDENGLHLLDLNIESKGLARNMKNCTAAVMMAATIGPGIDFLIRRAEAVSMVDAAIYQAAGAAYVESWCDEVNARINRQMGEYGLFGHPRFSPGYGDLPLSLQKDFSRILDMPRNCGISLTDTLLMTPSKSVTAFIGFSPKKEACAPTGCGNCESADTCEFSQV